MIDFKEQVVIVTGAGRGLGRLYALELARRGAAVVVNDLGGSTLGEGSDVQVADRVVAEIARGGGTALASHESVAEADSAASIVRKAVDRFGRLDIVISNAGIHSSAPFEEMSIEQWRRTLSVHLDGSFYLAQPAFRVMKAQGYGRFVFTTSSVGLFGQAGAAHYGAAKGGVVGLSNVVAIEGAPHGILSNSVLPWGLSRMLTAAAGGEEAAKQFPFLQSLKAELVVPLVVFLASRACTVSHRNYSAAAGRYARVFAGIADGWLSEQGSLPTAEDIETFFAAVDATAPFYVPQSVEEEAAEVCARRGF